MLVRRTWKSLAGFLLCAVSFPEDFTYDVRFVTKAPGTTQLSMQLYNNIENPLFRVTNHAFRTVNAVFQEVISKHRIGSRNNKR